MAEMDSFSQKSSNAAVDFAVPNSAVKAMMGDYADTFKLVDSLEKQLSGITASLLDAQKQLEGMKMDKHPLVSACKQEIRSLLDMLKELLQKIVGLKNTLVKNTKRVAATAKERGQEGYLDAMKALGVKERLMETREMYQSLIAERQGAIARIDAVSHEIHAMTAHMGNIGRAAAGMELKETRENGKFAGLLKAIPQFDVRIFQKKVEQLNTKIAKLEQLEQIVGKRREARAAASQNPSENSKAPGILGALAEKQAQVRESKLKADPNQELVGKLAVSIG